MSVEHVRSQRAKQTVEPNRPTDRPGSAGTQRMDRDPHVLQVGDTVLQDRARTTAQW